MYSRLLTDTGHFIDVEKVLQFKIDELIVRNHWFKQKPDEDFDVFLNILKVQEKIEFIHVLQPDSDLFTDNSSSPNLMSISLPLIASLISLTTKTEDHEKSGYYTLGVLWFQRGFYYNQKQEIMDRIKSIPFAQVATFNPWPF